MQPQCGMQPQGPCSCGVFVLLHVVVEGGRASLNHAHHRGRTTRLRLSLTDVAPVLRPHGFSICGFPRGGAHP